MNADALQPPAINPTDLAVMNNNIGYIQRDIATINQSIKELSGVYATQVFVSDSNKAIDLRVRKLEEAGNLWRWLGPTLSAVLGSVMTFLVIAYLGK